MLKWALLFWTLGVCVAGRALGQERAEMQQRAAVWQRSFGKDTAAFSFSLLDWHRGDTVYAHADSPRTVLRYFNKNLRGLYQGDTAIITGEVVVTFVLDKLGKCIVADFDTATNNPELVKEVVRVVSNMNRFPIQPTRAGGRPLVSVVRLKVAFEEWDSPPKTRFQPDVTVGVGPIQY